jgi:hypothetical protein
LLCFVASIHSSNAEKLFCLLRWSSEEQEQREKKTRIQDYLDRFLATVRQEEEVDKKEISYSIIERHLLLIDWLQDRPAVIDAIRANYDITGENCAFRVTTFYNSAFKELNAELMLSVTNSFLISSPRWSGEEFKKRCIALPQRVGAANYFEKAVVEAVTALVDPQTADMVGYCLLFSVSNSWCRCILQLLQS